MTKQPMETAPKDGSVILLHAPNETRFEDRRGWTMGFWYGTKPPFDSQWQSVEIEEKGMYDNDTWWGEITVEPDGWAPLPGGQ